MGARRVAVSTARSTATWVDGRFAFGSAALQLGGGRRVAAHPGDGDDVDGAVELPSPRRLRRRRAARGGGWCAESGLGGDEARGHLLDDLDDLRSKVGGGPGEGGDPLVEPDEG